MSFRYALFFLLTLGLWSGARAQQPFARFGVKVEVLSLSNGRYPEFFPNDSLRRIGSVIYNRRLHRIAYLLPPDSLIGRAKSEVTSRWWVVDPHAENYTNITPYAFVENNPINHSDPDGRDIIYHSASSFDKRTGITTVTVTADVSIKILNNSQLSQSDFNSKVADYKTSLSSAFNNEYDSPGATKVHYVFKAGKMDIQAASSMKDVRSTDNLLVMVDEVTGKDAKGGDKGGVAEIGGRIGYVEPTQDAEGMVHETGHQMGLLHTFDPKSGADTNDRKPGNYMSYDKNKNHFTGHQLFQSLQATRNRGSNSSTAIDPISTSTTTQAKPYRTAQTGDKVPRAL